MSLPPLLFSDNDKQALVETIKALKLPQIKDVCKALGLLLKGNKSELVTRLLQFVDARVASRLAAELLAVQTIVLKLLYNSPLPSYLQLVSAIRNGVVSENSLAALLESFAGASMTHASPAGAGGPASISVNQSSHSNHSNHITPGSVPGPTSAIGPGAYVQRTMLNTPLAMANMNHMPAMPGASVGMSRHVAGMGSLGARMNDFPEMAALPPMASVVGRMDASRASDPDAYCGPMLLFKSTLFYLLRRLIGTAQVLRVSKARNVKSFRMKLHSSDVRLLHENPNARVYIFAGTESTVDHTNTPIQFPPIEIYVDDVLTKQFTKGFKGRPGSARPADLTPYFSLFDKLIVLRIVYLDALEKYILYTYIVEEFPLATLVEQIAKKPHISAAATRAQIQKQNDLAGDDADLVVDTSSLTLRCPLTYARMKVPVRSVECDHIQCFDSESFLSMQQKIPLWQCPVCSKYIDQNLLAVSDYLADIIAKTANSVDSVNLNADGSWKAVEGDALLDSDDDDDAAHSAPTPAPKAQEEPIEIISLDSDSEPDESPSQDAKERALRAEQGGLWGLRQTGETSPLRLLPHVEQQVPANHAAPNQPTNQPPTTASAPATTSASRKAADAGSPDELHVSDTRNDSISDFPLSNVPPLPSQKLQMALTGEPAGTATAHEPENPDDDNVTVRPRRRAVITDDSETDVGPSSVRTTRADHESIANDASPMEADLHDDGTALAPLGGPQPSTVSAHASNTAQNAVSGNPASTGVSTQPAASFVPHEAQFLRTMKLLPHLAPDVNPFASPLASTLPRALARVLPVLPAPPNLLVPPFMPVRSIAAPHAPLKHTRPPANQNSQNDTPQRAPHDNGTTRRPSAVSAATVADDGRTDSRTDVGPGGNINTYYLMPPAHASRYLPVLKGTVSNLNEQRDASRTRKQPGATRKTPGMATVPERAHSVACPDGVRTGAVLAADKTPLRKRNNSVTGGPQALEPTLASPSLAVSSGRVSDPIRVGSSERPETGTSGDEGACAAQIPALFVSENDTSDCSEHRPQTARNSFKDVLGATGGCSRQSLTSPRGRATYGGFAPHRDDALQSALAETDASHRRNDALQTRSNALILPHATAQPDASLYVSPVGMAIGQLLMGSPMVRKRPDSINEPERYWNKKTLHAPDQRIETSAQPAAPRTKYVHKAKFDPSTINASDIIELD